MSQYNSALNRCPTRTEHFAYKFCSDAPNQVQYVIRSKVYISQYCSDISDFVSPSMLVYLKLAGLTAVHSSRWMSAMSARFTFSENASVVGGSVAMFGVFVAPGLQVLFHTVHNMWLSILPIKSKEVWLKHFQHCFFFYAEVSSNSVTTS